MKKILMAGAAFAMMASGAFAERYVMVTHTQGTDPFWPVVEKGGRDAAEAIGADFEYNFDPTGDMSGMAKLIEAAAATQPDGIIVSLPDADGVSTLDAARQSSERIYQYRRHACDRGRNKGSRRR